MVGEGPGDDFVGRDGVGGAGAELKPAVGVNVYLCRHGTTEWNKLGKWQGEIDTPLAAEGIAQAEAQAAAFVESGIRFGSCVCSDLKRASFTAEILCVPRRAP